jgi:hypothetical protein
MKRTASCLCERAANPTTQNTGSSRKTISNGSRFSASRRAGRDSFRGDNNLARNAIKHVFGLPAG